MNKKFSQQGFTLIELLVVIVIIGILATGAVAVFGSTQARARDAVRQNDLSTMHNGIEVFKVSGSGNAPVGDVSAAGTLGIKATTFETAYIQAIPAEPNPTTYSYSYNNAGDDASFEINGVRESGTPTEGAIRFGTEASFAAGMNDGDIADLDCTDIADDCTEWTSTSAVATEA